MKNSWIIRFAVNAVALYAAIAIVPGLAVVNESWVTYLGLAFIFGIVNAFIGPVLKLFTCPFYILTLGLFSLVVNTLLFEITAWIGGLFGIELLPFGFWDAFLGALVVSIVHIILFAVLPDGGRPRSSVKTPKM